MCSRLMGSLLPVCEPTLLLLMGRFRIWQSAMIGTIQKFRMTIRYRNFLGNYKSESIE